MNSPASSSESSSFQLLDPRIQRWIWSVGWSTLRDIQEQAIPAIIEGDRDVIISAATASGKTEAAFLPILSNLLNADDTRRAVLYISPLKALINDQWDRLTDLCSSLDLPVIAWHGDISSTRKHRFLTEPRGTLLITPESLEALFVRRGSAMPCIARSFRYVVVDELHAFIGTERGKQLQSLMHRVELVASTRLPRIALSATLGDMSLAAQFLRPGHESNVAVLNSCADRQQLKIIVKGYKQARPTAPTQSVPAGSMGAIASALYSTLRGSNNLVFPNSRALVEVYADTLRRSCEKDRLPNEFWPHHGNLSKEIREQTEAALKKKQTPATAICTSTLELGVDIGSVRSVAQIGPPPSVASLRQRLGRSGRRPGEAAILRCYCSEVVTDVDSSPSDRLRESLVQTIATIRLLGLGWFEPPHTSGLQASTFVQQVLSVIAERGGATAASLWSILVEDGPFPQIERDDFTAVLKELGAKDLIAQDKTGLLLHGGLGERMVNHYDFYAAFVSEDEFTVQHQGRTLGSIPVNRPMVPDQRIIFAGRRWKVVEVELKSKRITVKPDVGGAPPTFDSSGSLTHDRIRQEMKTVLGSSEKLTFIDEAATVLLAEAMKFYAEINLAEEPIIEWGDSVLLFTWRGDRTNDALALMLSSRGHRAWNEGLAVHVPKCSRDEVRILLKDIKDDRPDLESLQLHPRAVIREKWDWALPPELLVRSYASHYLDLSGAIAVVHELST